MNRRKRALGVRFLSLLTGFLCFFISSYLMLTLPLPISVESRLVVAALITVAVTSFVVYKLRGRTASADLADLPAGDLVYTYPDPGDSVYLSELQRYAALGIVCREQDADGPAVSELALILVDP